MKVKNTSDKRRDFMPTHVGGGGVSFMPGEVKDLPDDVAKVLVAGKNDIEEVKLKEAEPDKPANITVRSRVGGTVKRTVSRVRGGKRTG